jgi:small subunit ribosomal protein S3Ae
MAVGKNKKLSKKGKGTKKVVDPFLRKDFYDIRAPSVFAKRDVGKTIVTKTTGTKIASENLKGRVFEASLADLNNNEDDAYRKIQLKCEEVEGTKVLTTFYGMDLVRHKIGSLLRKWQTLIEAHVDVKTTDGYTLRLFCIGFTKKRPDQIKKTCYASSHQIRKIRRKMVDIMTQNATKSDLRELTLKFIPEKSKFYHILTLNPSKHFYKLTRYMYLSSR